MSTLVMILLLACCTFILAGIWFAVADIRIELRHLIRDYEQTLEKDVRSRVR